MLFSLRSTLTAFMFPGGLLVLMALAFLRPTALPAWIQPPLHLLPLVVLVLAGLFAWLFDRARVALTLLVLVMSDLVLSESAATSTSDISSGGQGDILYHAAALLVPLNVLGLAIYSHDRIRNVQTLGWLVSLLVQATIVVLLRQLAPLEFSALWHTTFVPPRWTAWSPLTQPALVAFILATGLLVFRFLESRNALETGFVWTIVAIGLAFFCPRWGWDPRGFLMTAGLTMTSTLVLATYRSAHRDELTGLPDREALNLAIQRLGGQYAVALLEIDQLREINGTYGRRVGDQVMAVAARKVVHAGGVGTVFVFGQDQFLVLFSGKSPSDALVSLESMRKAVEALDLVLRHRAQVTLRRRNGVLEEGTDESLSITLSLGVAGSLDQSGRWDAVLKAACTALFQAKRDGGNVVRRSAPQKSPAGESGTTRRVTEERGWQRTGAG